MDTAQAAPASTERRYLDYTTGAEYLNISASLLAKLVARGAIPAIRHGRRVTIDRVDLDQYAQSLKQAAC